MGVEEVRSQRRDCDDDSSSGGPRLSYGMRHQSEINMTAPSSPSSSQDEETPSALPTRESTTRNGHYYSQSRYSQNMRRSAAARRASQRHADNVLTSLTASHHDYKWRLYAPLRVDKFFYWLVTGHSSADQEARPSDQENKTKIRNLARVLILLREYERKFGMPECGSGGQREQEWVLRELCKRLFYSGVPIWVLEPVMGIAAQGMTGLMGFGFFLLPSSGIMIPPHDAHGYSSDFFRMRKSFCMYQLELYEKVLARLASFSTNTRTINSVKDDYLPKLLMNDEILTELHHEEIDTDRETCANEILDLASKGYGLFFLTRVEELLIEEEEERLVNEEDFESVGPLSDGDLRSVVSFHSFWNVDDSVRELFTRLATIEAADCLDAINRLPGVEHVWPRLYVALFRALSAAGSSALWFEGSWHDMLFAGGLAGIVAALLETNETLWTNQRMVFEVFVSFVVGFVAGIIAIRHPDITCFSAIAIASMIDYLRGFGIVFSVMEIMSKNTMAGSSDLIEALVFSFLISMSILFGLGAAEGVSNVVHHDDPPVTHDYMKCINPVPEIWFILILPFASLGWAAMFRPAYKDMPLMALHGIIAFTVSFVIEHFTNWNNLLGSFIAALTVSTFAGLVSRFTGRQALGDTFTGLYSLVPGIYITKSLFDVALTEGESPDSALFFSLALRAVIIGVGSWCGTLLCAPTNLGTNSGILSSSKSEGVARNSNSGAMLYI